MIEFSEQNKMGIIKESAYKADFFDEKKYRAEINRGKSTSNMFDRKFL